MTQTPLILDADDSIRNDEREPVPEPGKICLMHLVERYVEGNTRAAHSDLVMKMGLILSSHGSTGYDLLHRLFGFPSLVSIWRHFHSEIDMLCGQMTNTEFLSQCLFDFRMRNHLNETDEIRAILGVDAFSVLSDSRPDVTNSSCFLFMIIPLNSNEKPFPIRLKAYPHGSADRIIQEEIDGILNVLGESRCFIHFAASDGDPGYSPRHRAFFLHWFRLYIQNLEQGMLTSLHLTLEEFATVRNVPILDILHIAKNFRAKCLDHPICLNPTILDWQISGTGLAQVLDIGDALSDCSQIGKMRDSYPILLFTFHNAYRLIVERRPMESLFILLLALPLAALREEGIARDQRIFYADLAFLLMMKIYAISDLPRAEGVTLVWRKGRCQACLLATESMW
jgi:hypothetical protein